MPNTTIVTDTASIAVFDEETLRHCVDYDSDWWTSSLFPERAREVETGNLYLIDTGFDGRFDVVITRYGRVDSDTSINVKSGSLVCVCGEEIPADGLFPQFVRGGLRLSVEGPVAFVRHEIDGTRVVINVSP